MKAEQKAKDDLDVQLTQETHDRHGNLIRTYVGTDGRSIQKGFSPDGEELFSVHQDDIGARQTRADALKPKAKAKVKYPSIMKQDKDAEDKASSTVRDSEHDSPAETNHGHDQKD